MNNGSKKLNDLVDEAGRKCREAGYTPGLITRMRHDLGTLGAMKKLFVSPNIESGLERCLKLKLREYTLERIALKCPDEFTAAELQCARWKLQIAEDGMKPK